VPYTMIFSKIYFLKATAFRRCWPCYQTTLVDATRRRPFLLCLKYFDVLQSLDRKGWPCKLALQIARSNITGFFLWHYLKNIVYQKYLTTDDIRTRIKKMAWANIPVMTLMQAENAFTELRLCIYMRGCQFK